MLKLSLKLINKYTNFKIKFVKYFYRLFLMINKHSISKDQIIYY